MLGGTYSEEDSSSFDEAMTSASQRKLSRALNPSTKFKKTFQLRDEIKSRAFKMRSHEHDEVFESKFAPQRLKSPNRQDPYPPFAFSAGKRRFGSRSAAMSFQRAPYPNARYDPAPLPPPRYIADITANSDLGWVW